ncbi:MAG: acetyl-CoA carboxylase carboxyltransferase subunit beta [Candidatus Nitrohelix vancouverensis]|uniref:Acetyl-coenzyme A carboxylase carboxyl transferase subunit beta n=1 Tax=Candidatus Nitrohelix vancouverensis TaxID=2705534 RepID=A0A7T0C404_9BACT|nr:MAG: acetyl-CoA carboxylase carboxyltransferase subunit beta [Candidatus Nitrohelix vancouverensis]
MSWFDKIISKTSVGIKSTKPDEIWIECSKCKEQIYTAEFEENLKVCPKCDHHYRLTSRERIHLLTEQGSFKEHDADLISADPLKFKDKKKYKDRIKATLKKGISNDAIVSGTGRLNDHEVELCVFEFNFMGGSMGSVVGEKITRGIERALKNESAMIIVNCSGGARMQEGILSLMQMAKTASALKRLADQHIPYISILTDPTTGGVSASFAMLGDIIIAEPGALVGFAGPRVIEQTIQQKLPKGFQTAEFLLDHGLIDQVVHRRTMKNTLNNLLSHLKNTPIPSQLQPASQS